MTEAGTVYGEALYELAKAEGLSHTIWQQLSALKESFAREPEFLGLLSAPNLSKAERCQVLDDSFRGRAEPYLLNFLKILTEKGYIRHFPDCCQAYSRRYFEDNNILKVRSVTALPLTEAQTDKLKERLAAITGKKILLESSVDENVLGGVRLDYDGKRLDDTVAHRLSSVEQLLSKTVL